MKRFLSVILSVAMLCSVITIPALTASASVAYPDYVVGDMPQNMLRTVSEIGGDSPWWVQMGTTSTDRIARSTLNGYKGISITAKGTAGELMSGAAPTDSAMTNGLYINTPLVVGNNFVKSDGSSYEGDIAGGKSYVYKVQVKNLNPDITPNIHVRLYDRDGGGAQYTKEHGSAGMAVTSTEWMDLKGTIYNADDSSASHTINNRDMVSIGFPTATTYAGSSVGFNLTDESTGMYRMYFAEEKAYDITNTLTTGSAVITTANTATFKAQVLNQIGLPGYLDQTFRWMALDSATRTTEIEGIVITPSQDTATATVGVTADVDPGTYDIVAYSEVYNMAKGYRITVDVPSKYVDYIPVESDDNLVKDTIGGGIYDLQYIGVDNDGVDNEETEEEENFGVKLSHRYTDSYIAVKSGVAYDGSTKVGKFGSYKQYGSYISPNILKQTPANATNYVVKFAVRKSSNSPANPKVSFIAHDPDNGSVNHTSKNYGAAGLMLTDTSWVTFKDTLRIPAKRSDLADRNNVPQLEIAFPVDTLAGTSFDISWKATGTEPFYLAVENVHDITTSLVSGSSTVKYGDTIKLKAEVVNQVGLTGYLNQNFTWKALDKDTRKLQIDGITVTPSRDTTTANVFIGEDVPEGEYAIVAYSEDYSIAKGFIITVEDAQVSGDYVPSGNPLVGNIVSNNMDANNFTGRWLATFEAIAPTHTGGVSGAMRYPIVANPQYWSNSTPIAGGNMTKAIGEYQWKATNYVISTDLKNHPDASVKESRFGYMISSGDGTSTSSPYKFLEVTSSEWQTFKFVLPVTAAGTSASNLYYGYPNDTSIRNPQGTDILHRLGSFYIAEEIPYAINVSGENTTLRAGEGSLTFNAKVLNQLEIPYEGETNIQWYVMNEYRTERVDAFNLVASADGESVTVSAPKGLAHGKYVIVAEDNSLGISGFRKSMEFTLIPYDIDMEDGKAVIYVSPYGDDDDYGTKARPLATFEGALNKLEELHKKEIPVAEVIFRGGDYRINNAKVTDIHSGTDTESVVFKSYPGEKAVFKGSVELDMSKAEHVTDTAILNRMYPEVHDKVVVIDLEEQGISQKEITELTGINSIYGLKSSLDYNTIYVNNVEQPIAQWPNGREYTVWSPKYSWYISDKLKGELYPHQMGYTNGDKPDRWANATQWWVSVFPEWDFTRYRLSPQSIDTSKNIIYYPEDTVELTSTVSRRWKAYNLLEEIDLPGEFCIDRENMKLYFYPPYDTEDAKVEFSTVKNLLTVTGASNITFENLHFTQNTSTAITISDVVNVDFDGCYITNIGYRGLVNSGSQKPITGANYWQQSFMSKDASYNCDIRNCVFDNCGSASIHIVGGDTDTLTPSGNIIENNIITRSNQRSPVESALSVSGVGNIIRNNNISKSTQHAISMYGNDHLIEKNEIHTVLREVADAGAIYQGRNQMMRGSTISANLIHDIWPTDSRLVSGTVGIYMDDCQQGNIIKNNFLIGTKTGYNSHGAAAQKILNNIMVDNNSPWNFPGNPNSSTETKAAGGTNDWDSKDGIIGKVRSTMYDTSKNTDTMELFLSEIYDLELYRTRYPDLADWIDTNKNPHSYTVFDGNISVDGVTKGSMCWDDTNFAQIGTNPTDYTKDIFVDPDALDYRVKSTSEAAKANPNLLSDANFDIDTLGLTNGFAVDESNAPFKLIYPQNESTVSVATQLYWEDAFLADTYTVTIAKDANFTKDVITNKTRTNVFDISSLTSGTRYYWKVTAENTSRTMANTWESDVYTFFVSDIAITNTALLENGNKVSFSMDIVSNVSQQSYDATVYVAAYDSLGNMMDITSAQKTISSSKSNIPVEFDTKGEYSIDYVKVFVWKNGDVTPLRAAKVLTK